MQLSGDCKPGLIFKHVWLKRRLIRNADREAGDNADWDMNVEQSLMSRQLLRDQIKCWGPCSCVARRPSAVDSPLRLTPGPPQRNKTQHGFFLLISPDRSSPPPPSPPTYATPSSAIHLHVPHQLTARFQLTEGSFGWGLCYCEDPTLLISQ